jgi:hypothetical protein
MYRLGAYEEAKQRQERVARAAEHRGALTRALEERSARAGESTQGGPLRVWLRRGRRPRPQAIRLPSGAWFVIPGSAVGDWRAA